jgi:hypothetical protein
MANRHKKRNVGGATPYNAQGSNVLKEAKQRQDGGACGDMKAAGGRTKGRLDKKRASGGGVGADKHPWSSAHRGG